jgi:hypothetical protein
MINIAVGPKFPLGNRGSSAASLVDPVVRRNDPSCFQADMHTRRYYILKVEDCVTAVAKTADPAERLALLRIAQSYLLLADYVSEQNKFSPDEKDRRIAQRLWH